MPSRPGPPSADGARIVVAVDDPAFAATLIATLRRCDDFEVLGVASNGVDAVAIAEDLEPSIVIIDVGLSGLGGLEAARQVRQLPEAPAVVLVAGDGRPTGDPWACQSGAAAYVNREEALSFIDVVVGITQLRRSIPVWDALPQSRFSLR